MNRARLIRITVFLLFSATFIMASSARDETQLGEHWKLTGMRVQVLANIINDRYCRQDERAFLGCVAALDALLPPGLRLRPKESTKGSAEITRKFGAVVVAKEEITELTSAKAMLHKLHSDRRDEERVWIDLYRYHRFYFEGLYSELKEYVEGAPDEAERTARAYNAFLEFFYDPHSYILPAAFVQAESERTREKFVGIGIQLARLGSYPFIQSVMPGGPADQAGLKRHDILLAIDGRATATDSIDSAAKRLKGEPGVPVELEVWRDGYKVHLLIKRDQLVKNNVESRRLIANGRILLYVRISSFMREDLCKDLRVYLASSPDASGVILDLRDNGGGLLDAAACVVSAFVQPGKTVALVRDIEDGDTDRLVTYGAPASKLPLAVLVNSDSASASEIVAGAIQDHGRGWIVGERTWGKGSVQQSEQWAFNKNVLLFRTVARYYLPSGRSIQLTGIIPDAQVGENLASPREENLKGSVLPAEGRPRKPGLPQFLKNCVENSGPNNEPDVQLGVAEGLLACAAAP